MVVNTRHASKTRDVLRFVIKQHAGWSEEAETDGEGDVIWSLPQPRTYCKQVAQLRKHQRISRLPLMTRLCEKVPITH